MKIDNNRIKKFKIFNNIDDKGTKLFLDKLQLKSHKKNDIIMQEGDEGHSILFLLSGEITITKALTLATNKNNDNREKELIRCKAENNIIIGEVSLFSKDSKRTATVKALNNCDIAYLERKDFFEGPNIKGKPNSCNSEILATTSKLYFELLLIKKPIPGSIIICFF